LSTIYKEYIVNSHYIVERDKGETLENHIKQKSLVEYIVQDLEDQIISGIMKPGQRIIEEELCKSFRVSRSPVREALRILESQGLIKREPRKGVTVTKLSPKEAEDVYRIRANLESLATYLAVKNNDPGVLRKLKKIHGRMKEMVSDGGMTTAYFNLNLKFHKIFVDASENQRLIQMIESFTKQVRRYRMEVLSVPGRLDASLKNHDEIIQSFEAGDAEKAEAIRKNTILKNIKEFTEKIKKEEGDED
jgi:DNA-binding GntR family transcriptional regulator